MKNITVLLAAHNAEKYLTDALNSLAGQNYSRFKLLAVDDGSTDQTLTQLEEEKRFEVKVIRNEQNMGLTHSLNRGFKEVDTEFVARMDADDICEPKRFEEQIAAMSNDTEFGLIGSQVLHVDHSGRKIERPVSPLNHARFELVGAGCTPAWHPSVMMRTSVLRKLEGPYDSSFSTTQDYDLFERISRFSRCKNLRTRLIRYRVHGNAISHTKRELQDNLRRKVSYRVLRHWGANEEQTMRFSKLAMGDAQSDNRAELMGNVRDFMCFLNSLDRWKPQDLRWYQSYLLGRLYHYQLMHGEGAARRWKLKLSQFLPQ